jgi:hypothetical protein
VIYVKKQLSYIGRLEDVWPTTAPNAGRRNGIVLSKWELVFTRTESVLMPYALKKYIYARERERER